MNDLATLCATMARVDERTKAIKERQDELIEDFKEHQRLTDARLKAGETFRARAYTLAALCGIGGGTLWSSISEYLPFIKNQ
jgi:hypothetical protein